MVGKKIRCPKCKRGRPRSGRRRECRAHGSGHESRSPPPVQPTAKNDGLTQPAHPKAAVVERVPAQPGSGPDKAKAVQGKPRQKKSLVLLLIGLPFVFMLLAGGAIGRVLRLGLRTTNAM